MWKHLVDLNNCDRTHTKTDLRWEQKSPAAIWMVLSLSNVLPPALKFLPKTFDNIAHFGVWSVSVGYIFYSQKLHEMLSLNKRRLKVRCKWCTITSLGTKILKNPISKYRVVAKYTPHLAVAKNTTHFHKHRDSTAVYKCDGNNLIRTRISGTWGVFNDHFGCFLATTL